MSHADANFRNTAGSPNYYLGFDPGRAEVGVIGGNPSVPPFIPLTCGQPTTGTLYKTGLKATYRMPNLVANQRYYKRVCTLRQDFPGDLLILVTATGFSPYITLVRDAGHKWIGQNSEGGASIDITLTEDVVGPLNLEVSSVEPYASGDFEVDLSCAECMQDPADNESLPNGEVGVAYSKAISVTWGVAPYTFTVESGSLPTGLVLDSDGLLHGSPTVDDDFTFTIKVTDDHGSHCQREFTVTIAPATRYDPTGAPVMAAFATGFEPITHPLVSWASTAWPMMWGRADQGGMVFGDNYSSSFGLPANLNCAIQWEDPIWHIYIGEFFLYQNPSLGVARYAEYSYTPAYGPDFRGTYTMIPGTEFYKNGQYTAEPMPGSIVVAEHP